MAPLIKNMNPNLNLQKWPQDHRWRFLKYCQLIDPIHNRYISCMGAPHLLTRTWPCVLDYMSSEAGMGPVCNLYRSGQEVNQVGFDVLGNNVGNVFSGSGHCMDLKFSQVTSIAPFFRILYMDQQYLNKNQTMTLPLTQGNTLGWNLV